MKIKFNSDDGLPLNQTIQIPTMIKVAQAAFHGNNECHSQVSLDECLYKV